jgi:kinesin family protein C1
MAEERKGENGTTFFDPDAVEVTHSFSFDRTFGSGDGQEQVFIEVSEFVQSALDGFNVCLFSYGQTGSGKTVRDPPKNYSCCCSVIIIL